MTGQLFPVTSQFQFMALPVNTKDGHGRSDETCNQLQLTKTKVTLHKPI